MMTIWEHKIIYLEHEAAEIQGSSYAGNEVNLKDLYEDVLDHYGAMGWELATVLTVGSEDHPNDLVPTVWLKRPVVPIVDVQEPAPPL